MRVFLLLPVKAYALIIITASIESAKIIGLHQDEEPCGNSCWSKIRKLFFEVTEKESRLTKGTKIYSRGTMILIQFSGLLGPIYAQDTTVHIIKGKYLHSRYMILTEVHLALWIYVAGSAKKTKRFQSEYGPTRTPSRRLVRHRSALSL